jgi:molybdopterin converting factor small subunit
MKVQVNYTTQLKAALGRGSEQVELPSPGTLPRLLQKLVETHGATFRDLALDGQGQPLPSILLCIGDQQVDHDTGTELKEGDEVTILSAISGG